MTVDAREILDEYLSAVEAELAGISPSDRAEIILDLREHYEESRRGLPDPTEADLRNILERLGPPAEIAAEARQRLGVTAAAPAEQLSTPSTPSARSGRMEVGAIIGWIVWWPVGVLLMALSSRWTRREKLIALAWQLGGFAIVSGFFATPAYFSPYLSLSHAATALGLLIRLLIPPTLTGIFGAAYLGWRLAAPAPREWSRAWKLAGRAAAVVVGGWLLWVLVLGPLTLLLVKSHSG